MHDRMNRAGRRQTERGLLVPAGAAAEKAAQLAERAQRRAQFLARQAQRENVDLQRGSLAIAFLAQVPEHRANIGAASEKAVALLEHLFTAEILTEPDPDDEDEDEEDDEDEREP